MEEPQQPNPEEVKTDASQRKRKHKDGLVVEETPSSPLRKRKALVDLPCGRCGSEPSKTSRTQWPGCGDNFCLHCMDQYLYSELNPKPFWLEAYPEWQIPQDEAQEDGKEPKLAIRFESGTWQEQAQAIEKASKACPNSSTCPVGAKYLLHPLESHYLILTPVKVDEEQEAMEAAEGPDSRKCPRCQTWDEDIRRHFLFECSHQKFLCPFDEQKTCVVRPRIQKQLLEECLPHGRLDTNQHQDGLTKLIEVTLQEHLSECEGTQICRHCQKAFSVREFAQHVLVDCELVEKLKRLTKELPQMKLNTALGRTNKDLRDRIAKLESAVNGIYENL